MKAVLINRYSMRLLCLTHEADRCRSISQLQRNLRLQGKFNDLLTILSKS